MWIGSRELAHPCPKHVTGAHVFVFQPEKRQEEVRRLCQKEQLSFGARVKHEGSTHRDFMIGKLTSENQLRLSSLVQQINLVGVNPADEGIRQEELVPRSAASSSSTWQ